MEMLQNLDCGTKSWRSLTPPCTRYLCSAPVMSVEFANDNTLVSVDGDELLDGERLVEYDAA